MKKLQCEVCGFLREGSEEEEASAERPMHCGQPMDVIETDSDYWIE